jgi:hypothetical protein
MAVKYTFNGKIVQIPGSYATTKAKVNNQPLDLSYGNVLVIDKIGGVPFGGGSSVAGELKRGVDSLEVFDNLDDFRSFVRGGVIYDLALPLFKPNGAGSNGVSRLYYIRALTTTSAILNVTWSGAGSDGGNFQLKARHEGFAGNGYEVNASSAFQTVQVVAPGIEGDSMTISVNSVELGTYQFLGTETIAQTATAYAGVINANTGTHGYSATASNDVITILAPAGLGSTANTYPIVSNEGFIEATLVSGPTMVGGVTEQRAVAEFTVTNAGTAGNTITIRANTTTLGNFASIGGTTIATADGLALDINANTGTHGYSATSVGSTVTIYAPVGAGASGNGAVGNEIITGTIAITWSPATFAGGVDAESATLTLTVDTIGQVGNVLDLIVNGVTLGQYTVISGDTITDIAVALDGFINAGTGVHGYTSSFSAINTVTVTAPIAAGGTPNTYPVTTSGQSGAMDLTIGGATMTGGLNGSELTRGLCMTMHVGNIDVNKFKVRFWRGTFTGLDSDGQAYDGIAEIDSVPEMLAESPEFNNLQVLLNWMTVNTDFNNNIKLTSSSISGTGQITSADLVATVGNQLFTGATQVYNTARVTEVLEAVQSLDYTHILSLDSRSNYSSLDNGKLLYHIANDAKFEKFLWIGGGQNRDELSISIDAAQFYNYQRTQVVHGGCNVRAISNGNGLKEKSSLYKTAMALGRTCGLEPQTPLTFKALNYAGEVHSLSINEINNCIDNGVMYTNFDDELGFHCVGYAINTLQRNQFILNEDATSYLLSLNRITAQLNKEIQVNSKIQLLGNQTQGPNIGTLTPEIVRNWAVKFLKTKTASTTVDNLIISYQDITVAQQGDGYLIGYACKANIEINKLFITGTILDPNS